MNDFLLQGVPACFHCKQGEAMRSKSNMNTASSSIFAVCILESTKVYYANLAALKRLYFEKN